VAKDIPEDIQETYIMICDAAYRKVVSCAETNITPHEKLIGTLKLIFYKAGILKSSNPNDITMEQFSKILSYTKIPACIPPQFGAHMIAYLLIFDDSDISVELSFTTDSKYGDAYGEYMRCMSIYEETKKKGLLRKHYNHYNPKSDYEDLLFQEY